VSLEPIVHSYELTCRADQAFDVYVNRIGEWWHPTYTANADSLQTVLIEPGPTGRIIAVHDDIGEDVWGEVSVWEPPHRLEHTFTLAHSSGHASRISVEFEPQGDGCKMRFEHGGWNDPNLSDRVKFSDWPLILDRFAALANQVGG
jgi:Activator of Hsp90 ATPase homolog 1-like protein